AQFPTEKDLSERFKVNRHTVRRALSALTQRGLLVVVQGRGSFLVRDAIDYMLGPRTRFSENLLRQGREPRSELLHAEKLPSAEEVARQLKMRPGAPVVVLRTMGYADGRPISLGDHYFPARRVPTLIDEYRRERSITKALFQLGIADYRRK